MTLLPDFPFSWLAITRLGGVGVTLPLALAIAAWLAIGYTWKMALHWLFALGMAIAIVMVTKIAFFGWGIGILVLDFTGVSGHAMLSGVVYPVAFFLMLARARTVWRMVGVAAGLAMGITVSYSRIALAAHSPAEAIAGSTLGVLTALLFLCGWWRAQPHHRLRMAPVIFSLVALAFALHDVSLPTYHWITRLALAVSGHERPFIRAKWHRMNAMKKHAAATRASAGPPVSSHPSAAAASASTASAENAVSPHKRH